MMSRAWETSQESVTNSGQDLDASMRALSSRSSTEETHITRRPSQQWDAGPHARSDVATRQPARAPDLTEATQDDGTPVPRLALGTGTIGLAS
jgi:hypothetical protein